MNTPKRYIIAEQIFSSYKKEEPGKVRGSFQFYHLTIFRRAEFFT